MKLLTILISIILVMSTLSADVQNTAIDINVSDQEYIILSTDSFDSTSVIKKIDSGNNLTQDTIASLILPNDIVYYNDDLYISDEDTLRVLDEDLLTLDTSLFIGGDINLKKIELVDTEVWCLADNGKIYTVDIASSLDLDSLNITIDNIDDFQIDNENEYATFYKFLDTVNLAIRINYNNLVIVDTSEVEANYFDQVQVDDWGSYYYLYGGYDLRRTISHLDSSLNSITGFGLRSTDFMIDKQDTNEIVVLFAESDSLGLYDYKTLLDISLLGPDSTTSFSRFDIDLNWVDEPSAQEYSLQLAEDDLFTTIVTDTVIYENYLLVDSLDRTETYFWKVKALNIYDTTSWSDVATFDITNLNQPTITTPINQDTLLGNYSSIVWDDSVGIFELEISQSLFQDTIVEDILLFNEKEVERKLFYFDTTYSLRIRKVDSYEASPWSVVDTFYTGPLTIPSLQSPTTNSNYISDTTVFRWDGFGSGSFRMQISNDTSFSNILFNKYLESDTLTEVLVNNRDTLYWRTRNEFREQSSDWSSYNAFKSILTSPSKIYPNNEVVSTNFPILTWDNELDSSEYIIEILDSTQTLMFSGTVFDTDRATGFYLDSGRYHWKVRSVNLTNGDSSEWSDNYEFILTPNYNSSLVNDVLIFNSDLDGIYLFENNDVNKQVIDYESQMLTKDNILLTPNDFDIPGRCIKTYKLDFSQDFEFNVYMNFGDIDANGGSGMAIIFFDEEPSDDLGNYPLGLGYTDYSTPHTRKIAAIEFDTYNHEYMTQFSNTQEPDLSGTDYDHISFHLNNSRTPEPGTVTCDFNTSTSMVNAKKNVINIEDGEDHCVKVKWEYSPGIPVRRLSVYFDGVLRNEYNLSPAQIDSFTDANSKCFWGVTSSTGDTYKNNQTVNFKIDENNIQ